MVVTQRHWLHLSEPLRLDIIIIENEASHQQPEGYRFDFHRDVFEVISLICTQIHKSDISGPTKSMQVRENWPRTCKIDGCQPIHILYPIAPTHAHKHACLSLIYVVIFFSLFIC